MRFSIWFII